MVKFTISEGDCIESVASRNGVTWESIWNHQNNKALKDKRKDPNVLMPGDEIFIPDLSLRTESGATEQKHRFRRKGVPVVFRMKILRPPEDEPEDEISESDPESLDVDYEDIPPSDEPDPEPWAGVAYVLDIGQEPIEGETDDAGMIVVDIPSGLREATLIIDPGGEEEFAFPIRLGSLDPVDAETGACDRLNNLGYGSGDRTEEMTPELQEALSEFQLANGLDVTGELDDATKKKLVEVHGS